MILTLSDPKFQILISDLFKEAKLVTNQYPHKEICNLEYSKNKHNIIEQAESEYLIRNLKNYELKSVTVNEFYGL